MKQNDLEWFQPLWRRVAVTAVCVIWTGVEWWNGDAFWGVATGALAVYCLWTFFINFKVIPPKAPGGEGPDGSGPGGDGSH